MVEAADAEVARAVRALLNDPDETLDPAGVAAAVDGAAATRDAFAAPADAGAAARPGVIVDTARDTGLLGPTSTRLAVTVQLRMTHVPTSICHLFDPATQPLLSCRAARTSGENVRRLRVTVAVEGYSAPAIDTVELENNAPHDFDLLPTFYPERLNQVRELTRATVSVLVEDLDSQLVELNRTSAVWLLARTTAVLSVVDPKTGGNQDLTRYFGAFVTPNDVKVLEFLQKVKAHAPEGALPGYQGSPEGVTAQVRAVYDAVKADVDVTYVNTTIAFSPDDTAAVQRVRLPRESLATGAANCIDGVVLLASLLEAISLSPAIVVVPGHAFLGWETWEGSGEWKYLETTWLGTRSFDDAAARGDAEAASFERLATDRGDPRFFRRWPLRQLRREFGIVPMA
jgi:hypothetical protein